MTAWLDRAGRTRTLWLTGTAFALLTLAFAVWIGAGGLLLIDETWRPGEVRALVEAMSPGQRRSHALMTLVLDVPYPFAYGAFLAGSAWRAFGRTWLALPAVLAVPADLVEGAMQVLLLLTGAEIGYAVKAAATPIKLAAFVAAMVIGLAALTVIAARWARRRGRRHRRPSASPSP